MTTLAEHRRSDEVLSEGPRSLTHIKLEIEMLIQATSDTKYLEDLLDLHLGIVFREPLGCRTVLAQWAESSLTGIRRERARRLQSVASC
jgi:hypothetical protein